MDVNNGTLLFVTSTYFRFKLRSWSQNTSDYHGEGRKDNYIQCKRWMGGESNPYLRKGVGRMTQFSSLNSRLNSSFGGEGNDIQGTPKDSGGPLPTTPPRTRDRLTTSETCPVLLCTPGHRSVGLATTTEGWRSIQPWFYTWTSLRLYLLLFYIFRSFSFKTSTTSFWWVSSNTLSIKYPINGGFSPDIEWPESLGTQRRERQGRQESWGRVGGDGGRRIPGKESTRQDSFHYVCDRRILHRHGDDDNSCRCHPGWRPVRSVVSLVYYDRWICILITIGLYDSLFLRNRWTTE